MALRSQEEISLATVFTRALRNVIVLTTTAEKGVWPTAAQVLERSDEALALLAQASSDLATVKDAGGFGHSFSGNLVDTRDAGCSGGPRLCGQGGTV
jgi:hypothetical protein